MDNDGDPTTRRRQDREAMLERDAECWRLQLAGWSVRAIGRRLGVPASTVQRALERVLKRQRLVEAMSTGQPGDVVASIGGPIDDPEDVQRVADVARLSELGLFRVRYLSPGHTTRALLDEACEQGWRPPPPPERPRSADGKIRDRDSDRSWREQCDRAMADGSGSGTDDGDADW